MKDKLILLITKCSGLKKEDVAFLITVPPDQKLGDYAFPCFKLGNNPYQEAQKLQKKIKLNFSLDKKQMY